MNVTIYPGHPSGVNFEAASVVKNLSGATVQYCDTEDPFVTEGSIAVGATATLTGTYFFVTSATTLLSYADLGPDTAAQLATLGQRIADEEVARATADAAFIPRSKRPVHVKDKVGFNGDGVTSDSAAFADALDDLPATGGTLALPAGRMIPGSALSAFTTNGVQIVGEGAIATVLEQNAASGYLIDVSGSGDQLFRDFAIDGAGATGTAAGLRLLGAHGAATSGLRISGFTNSVYAMVLEGTLNSRHEALDLRFNYAHLFLKDNAAHTFPSNQNVFHGNCKFQYASWAAGDAILIQDSEGNVFDGFLCQGNDTLCAIKVTNTVPGNAPGRCNQFVGGWLEENGNGQVGSHGFHVQGANAVAQLIIGTVIERCHMFSSAHDNPSSQIYLQNCDGTKITHNYSNLGSPNKAVHDSTVGVTNTRLGPNTFAGTVDGFAANADTSGATLGALETEVNELKALLRARGLLAP
jgi:hypothetical protein